MAGGALFQINPYLLVYTAPINGERRLIAETNSASPPFILKNAKLTHWLLSLPECFTLEEAEYLWESEDNDSAVFSQVWTLFLSENLVIESDTAAFNIEKFKKWSKYGWSEAAIYHEATADYPFIEMDKPEGVKEDENRMQTFVEDELPPSIYQSFPTIEHSTKLNKIANDISLKSMFASKKFKGLISIESLSFLFDICFGERSKMNFGCQGMFLHKTIPSGGARHPVEVFYISFSNGVLPQGVHHYNVEKNSLDLIKSGDFYDKSKVATFDLFNKFNEKPSGLVVLTVMPERAMWRYREARSYRAILLDTGHALSALRMMTEKLGFNYYTYQKFRDIEICDIIGLDSAKQVPLFVSTLIEKDSNNVS